MCVKAAKKARRRDREEYGEDRRSTGREGNAGASCRTRSHNTRQDDGEKEQKQDKTMGGGAAKKKMRRFAWTSTAKGQKRGQNAKDHARHVSQE